MWDFEKNTKLSYFEWNCNILNETMTLWSKMWHFDYFFDMINLNFVRCNISFSYLLLVDIYFIKDMYPNFISFITDKKFIVGFKFMYKYCISSLNKNVINFWYDFIYPVCKCLFSVLDVRVKHFKTECDAESDIRTQFTPIRRVLVR